MPIAPRQNIKWSVGNISLSNICLFYMYVYFIYIVSHKQTAFCNRCRLIQCFVCALMLPLLMRTGGIHRFTCTTILQCFVYAGTLQHKSSEGIDECLQQLASDPRQFAAVQLSGDLSCDDAGGVPAVPAPTLALVTTRNGSVGHTFNHVIRLVSCRVPGDPTDESCTRFRFAGSITRIRNFILLNYDAINKTDRKIYHWKQQNILFATRYPLN